MQLICYYFNYLVPNECIEPKYQYSGEQENCSFLKSLLYSNGWCGFIKKIKKKKKRAGNFLEHILKNNMLR